MTITMPAHAVTTYAEDVTSGRVLVGKLVRLAAERHLRDIEHGHERGLWFDDDAADRAIAFFGFLRHSKGEWAGQPFVLEPWQEFVVGSLFGWKRADGTRRFRRAYLSVARKNGKTQLAAGIGLYLAFFDNEPGAEVYCAATKRDQAKICWSEAKRMVERTPQLKRTIQALAHNLHRLDFAQKLEPLSSDYNSLDGLNPHAAIIDEYHAHPNGNLADVLESGTGARRQPLMLYTTTAGIDNESACRDLDQDCQRVLEGLADDDSLFAYIARIDSDDSWDDPDVWPKANPNLGVSVKVEQLEEHCARAQRMPREQNEFRRKRCNEWTEAAERWLNLSDWDACGGATEPQPGQTCILGVDLSSTQDITACIALFPPDDPDGYWDVLCHFWLPAENIETKSNEDRAPYQTWVDAGLIEPTEGNIVDYGRVFDYIEDFSLRFQVNEIAYDPWNATGLATKLQQSGATIVPIRQGYASMSEPSKFLESLLVSAKMRHGGNPVLRFMAANVTVMSGANGSIRPIKPDRGGRGARVDGIVALIMAIGRAMVHQQDDGLSLGFWSFDEDADAAE